MYYWKTTSPVSIQMYDYLYTRFSFFSLVEVNRIFFQEDSYGFTVIYRYLCRKLREQWGMCDLILRFKGDVFI